MRMAAERGESDWRVTGVRERVEQSNFASPPDVLIEVGRLTVTGHWSVSILLQRTRNTNKKGPKEVFFFFFGLAYLLWTLPKCHHRSTGLLARRRPPVAIDYLGKRRVAKNRSRT